jgi:hypothetical protein
VRRAYKSDTAPRLATVRTSESSDGRTSNLVGARRTDAPENLGPARLEHPAIRVSPQSFGIDAMPLVDNAVFLITVAIAVLAVTAAAVLGPLYLLLRWLVRREDQSAARHSTEIKKARDAQIARLRRAERRRARVK